MVPPKTHTVKKNEGFLDFLVARHKLLSLTFLGLTIIVLIGLNAVKNELEKNLSSELQTILQSNKDTLRIWNQEKRSQVNNWANNPNVRESIISLSQLTTEQGISPDTLLKTQELTELRRILGPVCNNHNYVEFVVFDSTGLQIASLLDQPIGQRKLVQYSNFAQRSLEGETVVSLPFLSEIPLPTIHGQWKEKWPTLFVSAPVRDDSGEVVAVLSFRLRPEIEFSRITEIGRVGESGETYAFAQNGMMISNSRFTGQLKSMKVLSDDPDQMSMLKIRLIERGIYFNKRNPRLIHPVQKAIKQEDGVNIEGYSDYRGVLVIGAWAWLDEYDFGLVTEIDMDEAFAPFIIMKRVFISFFALLLVAIGAFWFVSTREHKLEKERKKVSGLLEDSEKKANLILSNTLDGIITIHPNGIVQSFNLAAEKIFGYKAEEILGKNVKLLMPELYSKKYDDYLKEYLRTGENKILGSTQEGRGLHRDGTVFDLELAVSEIFLQDERVFIGLVRDVTERKRMEDLSNRMGRILDDSFNEIYIFEAQTFKYVQVNRGGCENLGYAKEELLQLTPFDIFSIYNPERFEELIKPLREGSGSRIVFETEQKRKDGSSYPVEVRLQLTSIDDSSLFLAIVQDITERKKAERIQLQAQSELEDRVQQRTMELKNVNETLREEITERKVIETALRDNEAQIRAIVENVVDGIVTIDDEGCIELFNATAEQIFGYSAKEVIGKNISMLMPQPYQSEHDGYMQRYHETGEAKILGIKREMWGLRKDGSVFPIDLAVNEFYIGGRRAYTGVVQDITEKKQAQWSLERLTRQNELILKSVGDGIFGMNLEGDITFYNPSALKMTRFDEDELLGKSLQEVLNLLHDKGASFSQGYPLYQVFKDGKTQSKDEAVFWTKDGSALLAEYICAPIYEEEKIVGAVVTFRDILRRKRVEEALVQAKEEAERANRAKSDFLSRMSHELRTPLNSILGFAQIMEMDKIDRLTARQKPWVSQVRKAGDHLLELINEILDLARIESGAMAVSMENVDVVPILKEVMILIMPMSKDKNIEIIDMVSIPSLVVFGDRIRLKQVFLNLLSNAVKYNIENGIISIYHRKTSEGKIQISVEDSGIGVSKDKINDLFEPFARLDADNSDVEGAGIGLTITRRLVEQMRGSISVKSTLDEGSCFTLEFSAGITNEEKKDLEDNENELSKKPVNSSENYTLLYIEDNPDNLILVRQVLKTRPNIRLIFSRDSKTGIELALTQRPDLILMDINLPGMDGFTALKAIRAYREIRSIPVIAVSANAMKEDIENGLEAGFDSYITKPINIARFMEVVDRLLEQKKGTSLNTPS
jgi:PAS domain S-box-containing protein